MEIRTVSRERLTYLGSAVGMSGGLCYRSVSTDQRYVIGTLPNGDPLGDGGKVTAKALARTAAWDYIVFRWRIRDEEGAADALEVLKRIGYSKTASELQACATEESACELHRNRWPD